MVKNNSGLIEFVPDESGPVLILEHPKKEILFSDRSYCMGLDPVDHDGDNKKETSIKAFKDGKGKRRSSLGAVVHKRVAEIGGVSGLPVALIKYRSGDVRDSYIQSILLSKYYNSKINVEQNRYGFISFVKQISEEGVLFRGSSEIAKIVNGTAYKYGYNKDPSIESLIIEEIESLLRDSPTKILFKEIYKELCDFGRKNTDLIDAWGGALLQCKHYDILDNRKMAGFKVPEGQKIAPVLRRVNGKIIRTRK
jgi:hypothetical protein